MAPAVMQIGYGWPQCDGGAVLLNCLSSVSFCRLEIAHQLVQAIRVRVCLVEAKISRGCQFFVATSAPVGCLCLIPIGRRQSLQSLEGSFLHSCLQPPPSHTTSTLTVGPRTVGLPP